jgi:molybdopterin-containing oxidoreductase family membrane subunit
MIMDKLAEKREGKTTGYHQAVEHDVLSAMKRPGLMFWGALAFTGGCFALGLGLWGYQMIVGMGVSGLNNPVGWGVYITNFVFWVGIAHSGTLISAVLYLFRAKFRSSINRAAEAMTVFAVMTAGLFPLIHLGRAWFFFWLLPYPNERLLWVNFRSPLMWDVFAVSTYFTVSSVFFYVGMIPDLAIAKRFHTGIKKRVYGALSMGFTGTFNQWKHYGKLYMFLAAFATPLVVSVHSVVSWDFAMSVLPGWHTTIFAPYFVAGAIFSGTAMVITLVVPMRKIFKLERHITIDHFESLAKIIVVTSVIVGYSYFVEFCLAIYSGNVYEAGAFINRAVGPYRLWYWIMVACNAVIPLTLFVKKWRRNLAFLYIISIFVNIGMWLERFVIIVTSLSKDFNPYSWGLYKPSMVEVGITLGSFGFFLTWFLLFTKFLPVIAISELKEVADE